MYKKTLCLYLIVCAISLASCNTTSLTSNSDPLELMNRKIFRANDAVDQAVLRPVSLFYRKSTPQLLQNDIENFLQWLDTPNALVNNLLQGNFHQAETTLNKTKAKQINQRKEQLQTRSKTAKSLRTEPETHEQRRVIQTGSQRSKQTNKPTKQRTT